LAVFANLLSVPTSRARGEDASRRRRVVVVGAGITGLAAAARLRESAPDAEVIVLEASSTIGGKLALAEVAGIVVDVGAESMLNRRPEGTALACGVGLGDALVHPATTSARIWSRGALHAMPRTLMGVPTDARALAASGVISRPGLARAALDAVLPATRLDGDVSVGALVGERFGREVVDRLVEPLLGGVYAGHADELSARATTPQVVALLGRNRSLLKAAAAAATVAGSDVPVFAGLDGGLGQLPDAVVDSAGLDVRVRSTVRELARRPEGGWNLLVGSAHDPQVIQADAVVLATPARPAARLLRDVAPTAALELARLDYASMAIVTMAFRAGDLAAAVTGSGFLVPPVDGRTVKAATFSFAKWDWVRRAGAADDLLLLRCSIGRHGEEHTLQADDATLADRALRDLGDAVGVTSRPVDVHVQRWGGALPQYTVGHLDRTAAVRAAVAEHPGLVVCGAAYDGVGVPACIASGQRAATQVVEDLCGRERMGT